MAKRPSVALAGSQVGSHRDERLATASDKHEQQVRGKPRPRTDPDDAERDAGNYGSEGRRTADSSGDSNTDEHRPVRTYRPCPESLGRVDMTPGQPELIRKRSLGANLGATRADNFPGLRTRMNIERRCARGCGPV